MAKGRGERRAAGNGGSKATDQAKLKSLLKEFQTSLKEFRKRDELNFLDACKLGKFLLEMKEVVGHGPWGTWLKRKASALGVSDRTCHRWMRVADAHSDGRLKGITGLEEAYSKLTEPRHTGNEEDRGAGRSVGRFARVRRSQAQAKLDALFAGRTTVPTLEVQAMSEAGVRQGISQALQKHAAAIKASGAVILIQPAAATTTVPANSGSNRRK